jgi:hypothetical protein
LVEFKTYYSVTNLEKGQLLKTLEAISGFIKNENKKTRTVDSILIYYSGHGYYSADNLIAGIATNEKVPEHVLLTDIFKFFKKEHGIKRLFCYFDACRVLREYDHINYETIDNDKVVLAFAAPKTVAAMGNNKYGGYFTFCLEYATMAFVKDFTDTFLTENYLTMINLAFEDYIKFNVKVPSTGERVTPKLYVNKRVRQEHEDIVDKLTILTGQSDKSVALTKINDQAVINNRIETISKIVDINKQRKEFYEREYLRLQKKIKSMLDEMNINDKLIKLKSNKDEINILQRQNDEFTKKVQVYKERIGIVHDKISEIRKEMIDDIKKIDKIQKN